MFTFTVTIRVFPFLYWISVISRIRRIQLESVKQSPIIKGYNRVFPILVSDLARLDELD